MENITASVDSTSLSLDEVLDLEILLSEDRSLGPVALSKRDEPFTSKIRAAESPHDRLSGWIKWRWKQRFGVEDSLSQVMASNITWPLWVIRVLMFAAGFCFMSGALRIDALASVLVLLLLGVGLPFLLTLYGYWVWATTGSLSDVRGFAWSKKLPSKSPFLKWAFDLLRPLLKRVVVSFNSNLQAEKWLEVETIFKTISKRFGNHSNALFWTGASYLQRVALAYMLGVFLALLILPAGAARHLRWSTENEAVSPARIHAFCRAVAFPWSRVLREGSGYPSLKQIEQTNASSGEVKGESNKDARTAWHNFLWLTALVWGVLPRVLLVWLFGKRRSAALVLGRLRSEDARVKSLIDRLVPGVTPPLTTTRSGPSVCIVIESSEVLGQREVFDNWLTKQSSGESRRAIRFSWPTTPALMGEFMNETEQSNPILVILHCGAWQTPLDQDLDFIRKLRALWENIPMKLALSGLDSSAPETRHV